MLSNFRLAFELLGIQKLSVFHGKGGVQIIRVTTYNNCS